MDATELLKKDRQEVTKLFQRFHHGAAGRARRGLVEKICEELSLHTQIEEEIFYPAVRDTGREDLSRRIEESLREHQRVKAQVEGLRSRPSEDGRLESQIAALEQDVEHHVTEEEGQLFPRVEEVMDEAQLADLGERLHERKESLSGGAAAPDRRSPSVPPGKFATRSRAVTRRQAASLLLAMASAIPRRRAWLGASIPPDLALRISRAGH